MGGRVDYCARLESAWGVSPRGFESHPIRFHQARQPPRFFFYGPLLPLRATGKMERRVPGLLHRPV